VKHTLKGSVDLSSHFLSSGASAVTAGKMEPFQRSCVWEKKLHHISPGFFLLEKKKSTKIIAPLTKQLKIPFFEMFS